MTVNTFCGGALIAFCLLTACSTSKQQLRELSENKSGVRIGAYYFDGWTGKTRHIRESFNNFDDRKPIWGSFVTSTPELVKEQIDLAADAGLDFFSFCWYFDKHNSDDPPMNNALKLYLQSPNRSRLKFCLMVANHEGYYINPQNWSQIKKYWLQAIKEPGYLTVNGKPLLIFFEYRKMLENFGSKEALRQAFQSLKNEAKGLTIGLCTGPGVNRQEVTDCGFDLITGYNYHGAGLIGIVTPIRQMADAEFKIWEGLKNTQLPYIPVSTLNWDLRPWSDNPDQEKRFTGYGEESVMHSVGSLKKWLLQNTGFVTKEKIGILYAWNEYGEGGWLTPSLLMKDSLLKGVKQVLK